MSIIFLLLVISIFANAKFIDNDSIFTNYLDKKQTTTINGIFVFLVFLSHAKSYMNLSGPYHDTFLFISSFLNQAIVVTFLFYSGFGVMESIKRKGHNYLNTFPKKIITLFIQVDIAVFLFLLTNMIIGNTITLKNFLFALTTLGSIGNSNWYITAIIILYFFTLICFKSLKNNWLSLFLLTLLTIGVVYISMRIDRPAYTYNTIICYPFGIFYSLIYKKIEKYLKNNIIYLSILAVTLLLSVLTRPEIFNNIKYYTIWMGCFMIFILLFTMKVSLNNSFLHFLGTHIFSIYTLQRIPMMLLTHLGVNSHFFTFITISFISSLIMAILFDQYLMPQINKLLSPSVYKQI
ncbi:acyltransferase family protein [Vagococcus sp. DIV0080]|uniref:Acyltransferase family protein n=1 Tax=Candidatus Vagococcus giribetii TaxID=2230876 RepID=A0ABS3HQ38_9ENTE|nr:acyltransferase family protein [Vagococcus sp. DIV0080]MBO0475853.1 acyltransferase family protein [Vagococcus sp. DIV0080]